MKIIDNLPRKSEKNKRITSISEMMKITSDVKKIFEKELNYANKSQQANNFSSI